MDNDELLDRAQFGRQVELFWGSRVGGYLRNRAQQVYTEAIQELKAVDPTDAKAVARAQANVWRAESFEQWLTEAMVDGFKALEILEGDDDE
jgi:hypothetical protein